VTRSHLNVGIVKETFARFAADDASTYAAAIAYSTVFAIAPLIIIAVAIAGGALGVASGGGHGHHVAEDRIIGSIAQSAGTQTAEMVRSIVDASFRSRQGSIVAQIVGWVTFVIAASGLFASVQNALNHVWHVTRKKQGPWVTIRRRLAAMAMLLVIGALLILTTALNFAIAFLWAHFTTLLPFPGAWLVGALLNWVVGIAVIAGLFALMYKYLPDLDVAWGDVKGGALVTAVLFVVGQALLSVYISHASIANGYGAVGSLVVFLVWVYYSAMLLLIGAEFTRVYAEERGSLASKRAAEDADPTTRGGTARTTEGATIPTQRGEQQSTPPVRRT
jgi:membrane protein